jgi:guanylate kinase
VSKARGPERLLVVVSAPSGAGKTSLCERVAGLLPNLAHSVSHTTRQPRPDEEHGRDYYFVDEAVFRDMVAQDAFAEWATVHGHLYGTSKAALEAHFQNDQDVILDLDTQGAGILRQKYPRGVFVFVVPPTWEQLEARLRARRTDEEAEIQRRLRKAREEVKHFGEYEYVVVNDEFERAVRDLMAIILAERCKSSRADLSFLQGSPL